MKFNEFNIGNSFETKKILLTKDQIINFATQFDPQYFHVNEEEARESPFGTLIASGFHTLSVVWAEWIKMDILGKECLGGVGAEISWTKPVKPNDELSGEFTVLSKKESSSKKRGLVTFGISISNQDEEVVLKGKTDIYILV